MIWKMFVRSFFLHSRYGRQDRPKTVAPTRPAQRRATRPWVISTRAVGLSDQGHLLLDFLLLTLGLYGFQQWAFYRSLADKMEKDIQKTTQEIQEQLDAKNEKKKE